MNKNYLKIIRFRPPMVISYRSGGIEVRCGSLVMSWRFHKCAWLPQCHGQLLETYYVSMEGLWSITNAHQLLGGAVQSKKSGSPNRPSIVDSGWSVLPLDGLYDVVRNDNQTPNMVLCCLFSTSIKKARNWYFEFSNCLEIWQVAWQRRCQATCHISKQLEYVRNNVVTS